jgi:uncharacterized phage-associated protein
MAYQLESVADRFIELAGDSGLTHMQLQKLVYLAHELSVRRNGEPLVDCNPEVWQYGPVFKRLYHQLKIWRNRPINQKIDFWEDGQPVHLDANSESLIQAIWHRFGKFSGADLSNITHAPGTPWREVAERHKYQVPNGTEITVDDIRGAPNGVAPVAR